MARQVRIALAGILVLTLAACAKSEPAKDTTAELATPAPAPAPTPPLSLADLAGRWSTTTRPMSGADTAVTTAVIVATADTTGWVLELPSKVKVPHHVTVSGDSIMLKSDAYDSMRRKGKKVWTESVFRLVNGKLVGTTTAHYANAGADSVLTLRTEATRQ
ncbi:MAG: hypothetical protein DMD35_09280 [Gemmatimonadetes bacterium]|nr:MAG: hypothetical protein DMD35_09280 [Gemmatimonadota bacterium]